MNYKWRIYYADGSTFDDTMGEAHEAPPFGFIAALGYDEQGERYMMQMWDHYCYDIASNQWWGCDIHGLIDRLSRNLVYAYKQGRTITKKEFSDIVTRAHKDPDFPQKG